jgi:hypothetical protein
MLTDSSESESDLKESESESSNGLESYFLLAPEADWIERSGFFLIKLFPLFLAFDRYLTWVSSSSEFSSSS